MICRENTDFIENSLIGACFKDIGFHAAGRRRKGELALVVIAAVYRCRVIHVYLGILRNTHGDAQGVQRFKIQADGIARFDIRQIRSTSRRSNTRNAAVIRHAGCSGNRVQKRIVKRDRLQRKQRFFGIVLFTVKAAQKSYVLRIVFGDARKLVFGRDDVVMHGIIIGKHLADGVEIAEAIQLFRRHDIGALSVFVPGREHHKPLLPILFRIGLKIGITHPHKAAFIIGNRHVRIAFAVPRQAVEAGADGRHGIGCTDGRA